jgi:hypothetical protein
MGFSEWLRHHVVLSRYNIPARKRALEMEFVKAGVGRDLLREIFTEERKYFKSGRETWYYLHHWFFTDQVPVYTTHKAFIDIARQYRRSRILLAMVQQLRDSQKGENMGKITMDKFKKALTESGYEVEEVRIEGQQLLVVDTSSFRVWLKAWWLRSRSYFAELFKKKFDKE